MSELQRAFAKSKLAGLPPVLPEPLVDLPEDDEERDYFNEYSLERSDDDSSSASSASSTGTIRPTSSGRLFARPSGPRTSSSSLSPLSWTSFFERELYLPHTTPDLYLHHHAYLTSPIDNPNKPGPLFVTHHGAGSSGLSFALLAKSIRAILPNAGILSIDARGHGETGSRQLSKGEHAPLHTSSLPPSTEPLDFSLEALTSDLIYIIKETRKVMCWSSLPPIILIGHSLGGSVVTSVAASDALGSSLLGYAVLDIVERTAIESLASMAGYLKTRPTSFPTLEAGIEWHIRSGGLKNLESARVSVPPLLTPEPPLPSHSSPTSTSASGQNSHPQRYTWHTDLSSTSPFWNNWFTGLSVRFLSAKGGKLLLLAGTERLDTEMMIGQMQGKYALQIFPEAGHFLHEDQPEKTAQAVVEFYRRNDRSALVLPPKVSDLLKQGKKV